MKKSVAIILLSLLLFPLFLKAESRRLYPMMLGPRVSTTVLPFDKFISPVSISGDMLINLYKNYYWLRTDILSLTVDANSNNFGINLGVPFDFVFMGNYGAWRPYGFVGMGINVATAGERITSWLGFDAGGGASYEISQGLHLFAELGGEVNNSKQSSPAISENNWGYGIFLSLGTRFAFIW